MSASLKIVGAASPPTVHAVAALFPMLADAELDDLAADIKANGLTCPIVLDAAGELLIDGRNRLEACRRAGIEPRYERLPPGTDVVDYIWSVNIARRRLNASQRAIAAALMFPETDDKVHRARKSAFSGDGFTRQQLAEAREIVPYADLRDLTTTGALKFDHALRQARQRTKIATSAEHYLQRLQQDATDLAERVLAEELTLYEACTAFERRQDETAEARRRTDEILLYHAEALYQGSSYFSSEEAIDSLRWRLLDPTFREALFIRLNAIAGNRCPTRHGAAAFDQVIAEVVPEGGGAPPVCRPGQREHAARTVFEALRQRLRGLIPVATMRVRRGCALKTINQPWC